MEDFGADFEREPVSRDFIQYESPATQTPPKVHLVLLVQLGFSMALTLLGAMLFTLIATIGHWDLSMLGGNFGADATYDNRWKMRLMLGISHLGTFLIAGWATIRMFYPQKPLAWPDYLRIRKFPPVQMLMVALLMMIASIPLVLFAFNLNKMLPIPESWHLMEAQTNEAIKGLLQMQDWTEIVGNLSLIALLPAIGEELVFRGVLQQQLMRRISNPWLALLLSAAIFSFIHFQFEGFLPRLLLGGILGWLYWRTQNFWIPVCAHFFNNGFQVVGQYLYNQKLTSVDLEQDISIPWYAAILSATLVWFLARFIHKIKK
jgi:membrane protease YdiL (CAAX protease family)